MPQFQGIKNLQDLQRKLNSEPFEPIMTKFDMYMYAHSRGVDNTTTGKLIGRTREAVRHYKKLK